MRITMARISIEYCVECMYLDRALEAAQALFGEFPDSIEALTLTPGSRGVFTVTLDGEAVCDIEPGELPPSVEEIRTSVSRVLSTSAPRERG